MIRIMISYGGTVYVLGSPLSMTAYDDESVWKERATFLESQITSYLNSAVLYMLIK